MIDSKTGLAKPKIRIKFGTAGIRGIYGQEVSIRETLSVCYAVNELLGRGKFGIGYDSRKTSFVLAGAASSAMNWYGSDVDDYGMIPTPTLTASGATWYPWPIATETAFDTVEWIFAELKVTIYHLLDIARVIPSARSSLASDSFEDST